MTPAKVVIKCPEHFPMVRFEHDEGGGGENERLLPRGLLFRVLSVDTISERRRVLEEQGTVSDRGELYLKKGATLAIVHLSIIPHPTTVE
jgi:hypothetical protein